MELIIDAVHHAAAAAQDMSAEDVKIQLRQPLRALAKILSTCRKPEYQAVFLSNEATRFPVRASRDLCERLAGTANLSPGRYSPAATVLRGGRFDWSSENAFDRQGAFRKTIRIDN